MKLRNFLCFALFSLLLIACNSNSEKKDKSIPILRPASMVTTSQDTLDVMNLVEQYMEVLKSGDLQTASSMLYTVKNDSVHPYTEAQKTEFVNGFSIFHVFDYKINGLAFDSQKNNEVTVKIQIVPDGDLTTDKGVMSFVLNPVKIDNHWHLTLMDLKAEGVRRYYGV